MRILAKSVTTCVDDAAVASCGVKAGTVFARADVAGMLSLAGLVMCCAGLASRGADGGLGDCDVVVLTGTLSSDFQLLSSLRAF